MAALKLGRRVLFPCCLILVLFLPKCVWSSKSKIVDEALSKLLINNCSLPLTIEYPDILKNTFIEDDEKESQSSQKTSFLARDLWSKKAIKHCDLPPTAIGVTALMCENLLPKVLSACEKSINEKIDMKELSGEKYTNLASYCDWFTEKIQDTNTRRIMHEQCESACKEGDSTRTHSICMLNRAVSEAIDRFDKKTKDSKKTTTVKPGDKDTGSSTKVLLTTPKTTTTLGPVGNKTSTLGPLLTNNTKTNATTLTQVPTTNKTVPSVNSNKTTVVPSATTTSSAGEGSTVNTTVNSANKTSNGTTSQIPSAKTENGSKGGQKTVQSGTGKSTTNSVVPQGEKAGGDSGDGDNAGTPSPDGGGVIPKPKTTVSVLVETTVTSTQVPSSISVTASTTSKPIPPIDSTDELTDTGGEEHTQEGDTASGGNTNSLNPPSGNSIDNDDDDDNLEGLDFNSKDQMTTPEGSTGSYFMAYFITFIILAIAGYIVFHNKKKILGFIVEGRHGRGNSPRSRRSGGGPRYNKLEQHLDEVIVPVDKGEMTTQNYIY